MTPTLIDLAEYERVGEGANGASYNHRQDPNIMLKLYFRNFEAAELELELARKVYEMGIPTPEPGDLVTDGKQVGIRFRRLVDKKSFSRACGDNPHAVDAAGMDVAKIRYFAVMMSGAGKFPSFALPRPAEQTREYWEEYIRVSGCADFDALRRAPLQVLYDTTEKMKELRDDTTYCTMPVVDGVLIPKPVDELIRDPLALDYLIGYTNADMYAPVMAWIGNRFGRRKNAFIYFFDRNAPGDDNRAFHSADLRYALGTLEKSWRPYTLRDRVAEKELTAYLANFARCGDPNGDGLPRWERAGHGLRTRVLRIGERKTAMGRAAYGKMARNFLWRKEPEA